MTTEQPVEIKEILKMLPHRFPFILVDRILEYEAGSSIKGLKNITINEPFFPGHFPVEPVMPGVLIVEAMAQVGTLLAYLTIPEMIGNKIVYFAGIDKVRFRRKVIPGDQIIFDLNILKRKKRIIKMAARALVDDQLVTEAELLASIS